MNEDTVTIKKSALYNALLAFQSINVEGLRDQVKIYMEANKPLDGSVTVKDIRFIQQLLKKLEE